MNFVNKFFKLKYVVYFCFFVCLVFSFVILCSYMTRKDKGQYKPDLSTNKIIDYAVVSHTLKGDSGLTDELIYISLNTPNGGKNFWDFWYNRIVWACDDRKRQINEIKVNYIVYGKDKKKKERQKEADEFEKRQMDLCSYSYIFDHWEEINQSIKDTVRGIKRENRFFWPF